MKPEPSKHLDAIRAVHPTLGRSPDGANYGFFVIGPLRIQSGGSGDGWEHVSVSCADRCPTWDEMATVKSLFWTDNETVLQFHPRGSESINEMPFCLHLWKERKRNHPLPPRELI